ncbi:hypothetical protein HN51_066541 [Arachis hypogaea]
MITPRRRALLTSDPAVPNLRSHRRRSRTLAVVLTLKQPTRFRPSLNSPFLAKQFWNCPPEVFLDNLFFMNLICLNSDTVLNLFVIDLILFGNFVIDLILF